MCDEKVRNSVTGQGYLSLCTDKEVAMRFVMKGILSGLLLFSFHALSSVQPPEKPRLTIAVGGKSALYNLPLTIAERKGYFKEAGLQVNIADFAGGGKASQALIGGSADVVSGAYEHTIRL